jgi:hypothetical protein
MEASSAVGAWEAVPTTLPRRITVMVSETAFTSRSLWEMKTMEVPPDLSWRMMSSSSSVSCGVSTAVGSSRIRTLAFADQRLDDFHALLDAHGEVLHQGVGIDVEAVLVRDLLDPAACLIQVEEAGGLGGFGAEGHVLGDRKDGDQHEVLVHHADPGRHGVAGAAEDDGLVINEDLAPGRLI